MTRVLVGVALLTIVAGLLGCSGDENVSRAATPPEGPVYIESITPGSGTIGTEVVIRGYGFDARENDIGFSGANFSGEDSAYHAGVPSADGKTLRFELGDTLGACAISQLSPNVGCPDIGLELPIGELQISVLNRDGTSNSVAYDRQISPVETAKNRLAGSDAYLAMKEGLEQIVRLSGQPGGPYGTAFGIGVRESEDGEIYIDLTVAGMVDSELRDLVPEEIAGYEVRVTKNPAPQY